MAQTPFNKLRVSGKAIAIVAYCPLLFVTNCNDLEVTRSRLVRVLLSLYRGRQTYKKGEQRWDELLFFGYWEFPLALLCCCGSLGL